MIKPSLHLLHLDAGATQLLNDLVRKFRAAFVREFVLVVVRWKPEEIIDDISVLCGVDLDTVWAILPVCREDDDRFRLDFGRNLLTNLAQLRVGRMLRVFHKVGSTDAQEVDWHPWGRSGGSIGHLEYLGRTFLDGDGDSGSSLVEEWDTEAHYEDSQVCGRQRQGHVLLGDAELPNVAEQR